MPYARLVPNEPSTHVHRRPRLMRSLKSDYRSERHVERLNLLILAYRCYLLFLPPSIVLQTTIAQVLSIGSYSCFLWLTMSSARGSGPVKPSKTCDVCKLRHQKCDSSRPGCQYCALRDLECVYSRTPAYQVTGFSVRRRCQNPQTRFTDPVAKDLPWPNGVKRSGSMFGREGDLVLPAP